MQRILVRAVNWIGDAVMTTPALGAVRETFPDAHIAVVANPPVASLFANHPACDEVIVFDKHAEHAGIRGFFVFVGALRRKPFDCAILFQNAFEAAFMAFLAGIPCRAGYATDGRRILLTHPVVIGEHERTMHHTDYYLNMLAQCGIRTSVKRQSLALAKGEIEWAAQHAPQRRFAIINPGASYGSAKRWIPARFAAVADELAGRYDLSIVLTGSPEEADIGREIAGAMRAPHRNFIGLTDVRKMMALVAASRLLVTNDSGPMHVAAAFGVPVVAVFGPTDHTRTSPWGTAARIVRQPVECSPCLLRQCPVDHRCMQLISVDDVMAAVAELLGDP